MSERRCNVFAYGSNLSLSRIEGRVGRVATVATGFLPGHELRFHKRGRDGSGKADAFFTGRDAAAVWGVVYSLDAGAKARLDRFEGLGREYLEKPVTIVTGGGDVDALVYCARPERIDASLAPADWYLAHVVDGARRHGLPHAYVERVAAWRSIFDTDTERKRRETAPTCGMFRELFRRIRLRVSRRDA